MSGLRNFAVVGAGGFGAFVLEGLIQKQAAGTVDRVLILTRKTSQKDIGDRYAARGVEISGVDFADKAALKEVLARIDGIISTVGMGALEAQVTTAGAGKEVGAKLIVPSQFGSVAEGATGFLAAKGDLHAGFRAVGLVYLLVFTGPFSDTCWNPFADLDLSSSKVTASGDGNNAISFTSRPDIARFLVHALSTFPPEKLENRILRFEGDRKKLNGVFKAFKKKTGKKLDVTYRSIPELEAAIQANPGDVESAFHLMWARGGGIVGPPDDSLYPEWNPKPVVDYL